MSLTLVQDQKIALTESLLVSISEVMSSVTAVDIEKENILELGCYLYRTSPAIMELQITQNSPENATEILQSISTNVDLAKEVLAKCSTGALEITDDEFKHIIEQLERLIRNIGVNLSKIPTSAFENREYAKRAISSLSEEMKHAHFLVGRSRECGHEPKSECQSMEEKVMQEEQIPVQTSRLMSRRRSLHNGDMPRLVDFLKGMHYGANENSSQSFSTLTQLAEYIEPLYDTFFCPLTKKIMVDPVTIESGVTYERKAITEWFQKFEDGSEAIVCPTTRMKLQSRVLNSNIALKTIIVEWVERNELTRIRVARTALSLAISQAMVLDAIRDLKNLIQKKRQSRKHMHNIGITKLLTRLLENDDMTVRCEVLEFLCLLIEDEEGKEIIGKTKVITQMVNVLSSNNSLERRMAVSVLLELSKSNLLLQTIGSIAGAILMLITIKFNESADQLAADKAGETLRNLEKCPENIKKMAENGFLEPLLNHLVEGPEDTQMEMVSYLSELVLKQDMKINIAERTSQALIKMIQNRNTMIQKAAFNALVQISSYHPNNKTLVDAGVVPIMIEEMLTYRICNEPVDSKEEAAAVLANILKSGIDPDILRVNKEGHTITSHYSIYNITHMLKCSITDNLNVNLIKILLSLAELPKSLDTIVSVIRETTVSYTIIEFLNSPMEELAIDAAKLLMTLSSHIGHTIAEGLCKTHGQPAGLIENFNHNLITKRHAFSVNLLAKLPHQNVTLNLALLHQGAVSIALTRIRVIQRGETSTSRYARLYLEGLVGILVRLTATLYDPEILRMAMEQNLTLVFTELLARTAGSDEVQRLAAVGLKNLSSQSINLSRPLELSKPNKRIFLPKILRLGSQREGNMGQRTKFCPVHRGACSSATTFCLLESRAAERLLGCLEHENYKVVEAALSALCTLLDERVDVEKSVEMLSEVDAVRLVLGVLREHREEGVWEKSFWVIEKFLLKGGDRPKKDISSDRVLPSALVSAFHRGDDSTKQVAENILRHLNKMPHSSSNFVSV
ncbi:putative U-box domain-containing protein 42 isoform X1 [Typha angustifolia]|uniref:putative U-box domain-containing protein 42 isoform X1 n=2 Tax=Typha angustifolia TaxID=59011 RepID=UPI003C2FC500